MESNPNPNTNTGATAPQEPRAQEDMGQTRYFAPQGSQYNETAGQAAGGQTEQYNPYSYANPGANPGTNSGAGVVQPQAAASYSPNNMHSGTPSAVANPPVYNSGQYGNGQYTNNQYANGQYVNQPPAAPQYPGAPWASTVQAPPHTHHTERDRVMWGLILVTAGVLFLANQLFSFSGLGSIVLLLIGGVFMYAYFNTRAAHRVGYLIPGSILLGLGVGTALEEMPYSGLWDGNIVPLMLGLGFCLIWFFERKHWWALIPGGILVMVGLSSLLSMSLLWPLALVGFGIYLLLDQSRRHRVP